MPAVLRLRGCNMTTRQEIHKLMKKANARIEWIRKENSKNVYTKRSKESVDLLLDKAGRLTNVEGDHLRIGALNKEDEQLFKQTLEQFLDNPLTTYRGQKEMLDKSYESFNRNREFKIDRDTWESLTEIMESDTFKKFKESYSTYGGVLNEMAKDPKSYSQTINLMSEVLRGKSKRYKKIVVNGNIDVSAFIKEWKKL